MAKGTVKHVSLVGVHFLKTYAKGESKPIEDRVYKRVGLFEQPYRNTSGVAVLDRPYKWNITLFVVLESGDRVESRHVLQQAVSINCLNDYLSEDFNDLFKEHPDYTKFGYLAIVAGVAGSK